MNSMAGFRARSRSSWCRALVAQIGCDFLHRIEEQFRLIGRNFGKSRDIAIARKGSRRACRGARRISRAIANAEFIEHAQLQDILQHAARGGFIIRIDIGCLPRDCRGALIGAPGMIEHDRLRRWCWKFHVARLRRLWFRTHARRQGAKRRRHGIDRLIDRNVADNRDLQRVVRQRRCDDRLNLFEIGFRNVCGRRIGPACIARDAAIRGILRRTATSARCRVSADCR